MDKGVQLDGSPQFEALFVDFFTGESGDIIVELRLPRETLVLGGKIPVSLERRIPCEVCKGSGRAEGAPPCPKCEGTGRVRTELADSGPSPEIVLATCPTCDGRGHAGEHTCKQCERGYAKVDASVEVEIPAGSAAGMQLRVPGEGHIRPDKPQGDLVVVLAQGVEQTSAAAQKLPSFIVFTIITIVVLVLAVMMARQG